MHRPKLNVIQFKNQLNANELAFNALTGLTLNSTRNPETHSNTDKNKANDGVFISTFSTHFQRTVAVARMTVIMISGVS